MQLNRSCIHPVAQFHRQGKHVYIVWQRRQLEVTVKHFKHQLPQFDVVLAVGLVDFSQAMLGEYQLAGGGVGVVDGQHAQFDDA